MRIALVAPFAVHPKGTTRWRVLPLAQALADRGHAVRVVIPPYDWPAHSGRVWQEGGVQVVNVALPARLTPPGHAALAGRLANEALAWEPDVVHCFKPKGHSGLAAAALLLAGRTPVVVDADDFEAGWNAVLGYPRRWAWSFAWQERSLLRRAHAVTAASHWLANYAASLGQTRRFYLPNGVRNSCSRELSFDHRTTPDRASVGGRVLLYTRFVEHSPQMVWDVWRRVLAVQPAARLVVAGPGLNGEEHSLAEIASASGASEAVQILGWLPANSRPGLFAAVHAAMLPVQDSPLNRAKSPMRLLDLLAAGVPVATQRVGEYGTIVDHDQTGLLADPGDAAGLADNVVRLLRDCELRRRLGSAAEQDMRDRFAWQALASVALQAYYAADCRSAPSGI